MTVTQQFTRPLDIWPSQVGDQLNQSTVHVVNFWIQITGSSIYTESRNNRTCWSLDNHKNKLISWERKNTELNNKIMFLVRKKNNLQLRKKCYFDVLFPENTKQNNSESSPYLAAVSLSPRSVLLISNKNSECVMLILIFSLLEQQRC